MNITIPNINKHLMWYLKGRRNEIQYIEFYVFYLIIHVPCFCGVKDNICLFVFFALTRYAFLILFRKLRNYISFKTNEYLGDNLYLQMQRMKNDILGVSDLRWQINEYSVPYGLRAFGEVPLPRVDCVLTEILVAWLKY